MFLFTLMLQIAPASAQEPARAVEYKSTTELTEDDFGMLEVEAGIIKPSLTMTTGDHATGFPPMIRLRTDFNDEMSTSIDQVR